jgi:hypothetical protein
MLDIWASKSLVPSLQRAVEGPEVARQLIHAAQLTATAFLRTPEQGDGCRLLLHRRFDELTLGRLHVNVEHVFVVVHHVHAVDGAAAEAAVGAPVPVYRLGNGLPALEDHVAVPVVEAEVGRLLVAGGLRAGRVQQGLQLLAPGLEKTRVKK